jgi:DNA-binding NtrC family response regulator
MSFKPGQTLRDVVRQTVSETVAFHNGNKDRAALELQISVRTVRNILNEIKNSRNGGSIPNHMNSPNHGQGTRSDRF